MRKFLLLSICLLINNSFSGVLEKDSLALIAVYDSTNGANWNNPWDLNAPVTSWSGITVSDNRVVKISVTGTLSGTLPRQITDLDSLTYLRFYYTGLGGQFPADIGNLTKLEYIDLTNNKIEGTIPAGFYTLTNLKEVRLGINNLSGEILSEIANMQQLEYLALNNNSFSGVIPAALGDLEILQSLDLSRNSFSGTIPTELGNLQNVTNLNLYWNELSGTIPPEIGNLVKVENLRLANNDLEGEIPSAIGNLDSLRYLYLDQNNLSGAIPAEIGNCKNLVSLRAGYNNLTSIPDLSGMELLSDIWIPSNQFSGPLPDFFYNMSWIGTFNISGNQFDGELKADISNWQNLTHFYFGNNNFSGNIPSEVGTLKKVSFLELYSNQFTGAIPVEIGQMENLQYLRLYNNQLTGSIPEELANAAKLRTINIKQNNLKGAVPENFLDLKNLVELEISENQLTSIPEFSQTFNRVDLRQNRFTFEDIEPFLNLTISQFYYTPQDTALKQKNFTSPLNSNISLNMKIGGSANHYKWYKDGQVIIESEDSGIFSIMNMAEADTGTYLCEVTSDVVPDLTILTQPLRLTIGPAIADSLALMDLYQATNGSQWTNNSNWLSSAPISDWYGINKSNGSLSIDLSNNNLTGELPYTVCNLINVESINLSENNLTGTIPAEIGRITKLTELNLSANHLSGTVPEDLLLLDSLSELLLSFNGLTGLPDFNKLENPLTNLAVVGNALTFGDLEKNIGASASFFYTMQDSIGSTKTIELDEGQSFELEIVTDGSANHYQWYHNGNAIDQATEAVYYVDQAVPANSGRYMCAVTNDIVSVLTLYSHTITVNVTGTTGLQDNTELLPQQFDLSQNYPNPFNPATKIRYALPQAATVKLAVYNTLGQVVAELVNRHQQAGYHTVEFQADYYSSGLYFYVLETNGMRFKRKMLLIK